MKTILMLALVLLVTSCDKETYRPDLEWLVEATQKDLSISLYTETSLVSSEVLKRGDKRTITISDIHKMEIRCGNCEYKVNKEEIRGDIRFYFNGKREILY